MTVNWTNDPQTKSRLLLVKILSGSGHFPRATSGVPKNRYRVALIHFAIPSFAQIIKDNDLFMPLLIIEPAKTTYC